MANRAWSLRYFVQKLQLGLEEVLGQFPTSGNLTMALTKGIEAYRQDLTSVMYLTGAAMAPTLNPAAASFSSSPLVDRLLVRNIPRPSHRTVFVGDVVALSSPHAPADQQSILVRRVAAGEGEEMISDDPDCQPFTIPDGHCWVLADNEELKQSDVIDSRSFGPLPLQHVLGRIMYFYRSGTDFGIVENSPAAMAADQPVISAEQGLEKLSSDAPPQQ